MNMFTLEREEVANLNAMLAELNLQVRQEELMDEHLASAADCREGCTGGCSGFATVG